MNEIEATRSLLLAGFPVFAKLPPARLDELLAAAPVLHAPAGSVLFEPNTRCEGFPLVLEGSVRVAEGVTERPRARALPRQPRRSLHPVGRLPAERRRLCRAGVAETDVTLLRIPPQLFQQLLVEQPAFRRFVFDMYGARLAEVMELIEEVAFRKLDKRLARLLVQRGPVVQATHQNLADELGSVRVFVSRLLRSFEERGWLKLERERISVVDPKSLLEFSHL